jgi:hypothetical protein
MKRLLSCFCILFVGAFSSLCFAGETNRLQKEQIVYEGSIRPFSIPGGWKNRETFSCGMAGFTFNPDGDPNHPGIVIFHPNAKNLRTFFLG